MKKEQKQQYIKQYIYGYLTLYYNDLRFSSDYKNYKEFKTKRTLDYLYLDTSNATYQSIVKTLAFFEVFISICIVVYQFLKQSVLYLFIKKDNVIKKKIHYGLGEKKIKELFAKSKISTDDFVVVASPFYKTPYYEDYPQIKLLGGLAYINLLQALLLAIRLIVLMKKKYGKRDFLFRAYSSFEYFLVCMYFDRLDESNIVYFTNLADRWAYLFGNIKHEVVFLQHGIMPPFKECCYTIKVGSVDVAYYIDDDQRQICESVLFINKPKAYYQVGMSFTSNNLLKSNGRKNILLVCNVLFWEKEQIIIDKFSKSEKWNLYVKPHPTDDPTNYIVLSKELKFIILGKKDFPKVDQLISYDSTLATDYMNAGVSTLRYSDDDFNDKLNALI